MTVVRKPKVIFGLFVAVVLIVSGVLVFTRSNDSSENSAAQTCDSPELYTDAFSVFQSVDIEEDELAQRVNEQLTLVREVEDYEGRPECLYLISYGNYLLNNAQESSDSLSSMNELIAAGSNLNESFLASAPSSVEVLQINVETIANPNSNLIELGDENEPVEGGNSQ